MARTRRDVECSLRDRLFAARDCDLLRDLSRAPAFVGAQRAGAPARCARRAAPVRLPRSRLHQGDPRAARPRRAVAADPSHAWRRCASGSRSSIAPVAQLRVWMDGSDRVVVRHGDALYEPSGQMVIDFALAAGAARRRRGAAPARSAPGGADPESALEWFERGCRLDAAPATLDEAAAAYRRAIDADPDFADAHCNLGAIHHQRGAADAARGCYERALRCDPAHVEAQLEPGGDPRGGRAATRRRSRTTRRRCAPTRLHTDAHLAPALLYEKLGLRRRAREHWRRYLQWLRREPGPRSRASASEEWRAPAVRCASLERLRVRRRRRRAALRAATCPARGSSSWSRERVGAGRRASSGVARPRARDAPLRSIQRTRT